MAFFKFRKGGDEQSAPSPAPESVEALRRRARHRLIGSAVLVLIGVIGFPLVFDNQPRPVAVDIPIEIPDRAKVVPLAVPAAPAKTAVASAPDAETATPPATAQTASPGTPPARVSGGSVSPAPATPVAVAAVAPASAATKAAAKPETKADPKPAEVKLADKPVAKPVAKADEAAKAQALLDGKDVPKPVVAASAPGARFVVQVGAYADVAKAREARMKLEKAGLKTYTQVVNPPEGKRIRVRVGPFDSKAEVDKVAEKIRKLDLSAQILEL